jgi:hypothetical protein
MVKPVLKVDLKLKRGERKKAPNFSAIFRIIFCSQTDMRAPQSTNWSMIKVKRRCYSSMLLRSFLSIVLDTYSRKEDGDWSITT